MNDVRGRVLAGTFFHAPARGTIEVLQDALLAVDETGTISTVTRRREPDYARLRSEAGEAGALLSISAGSYVLPGLIDLHIHAPLPHVLHRVGDEAARGILRPARVRRRQDADLQPRLLNATGSASASARNA